MQYVIYALKEPTGNIPRYIGSTRNFKLRMKDHFSKNSKIPAVRDWMLGLRIKGLKPKTEILQECETRADALLAEGQWAMMYVQYGYRLLNKTIVSCPHCKQPIWLSWSQKIK